MSEPVKGYKRRIEKRRVIAKEFGGSGFYTVQEGDNKGKTYPKPMVVLLAMKREGSEIDG